MVFIGYSSKVGDGNNIDFWNHRWLGPIAFHEQFPSLFMLAGAQDWKVADYGKFMGLEVAVAATCCVAGGRCTAA